MNWVQSARLNFLTERCDDYILGLNESVGALAYTRISDIEMEGFSNRFIGKFSNLGIWEFGCNLKPAIIIYDSSISVCMSMLEEKLNKEKHKFNLIGIWLCPNDKVNIKLITNKV